MYVIRLLKDIAANKRLGPDFGVWAPPNPRWPGYYEEYWMNDKERFYLGIFIIQILNLIAAFFLLFASAALIYGIHTSSKHMVWPWFPCMVCSILCSGAYCIMWWAGNVESYWLVLTIIEFLAIMVNLYCLLCVIVQYRRIIKGYVQQTYDDDYKPQQVVYEYRPKDQVTLNKQGIDYYEEKKKIDGYHNATYEPDINSKHKVYLYKGGLLESGSEQDMQQKQQNQQTQTPLPQYQPFQVQYYPIPLPQQAQELPLKTAPIQPSPEPVEFKSRFTEAWVKGVNNAPPGEPPNQQVISAHSSPERQHFKRTKSVDAIEERSSRRRRHHRHQMKHSKSKESVSSRNDHKRHRHRRYRSASSTSSSSSSDYDDDESRSRRKRGGGGSDSDTGYSASVAAYSEGQSSRRSSRRHRKSGRSKHHHDGRDKDNDANRKHSKRDKGAAHAADYDVTPALMPEKTAPPQPVHSRAPAGGVPVLPMTTGAAGGITIPQHIVIPRGGGSSQPQRYHINSEITIRYNKDGNPVVPEHPHSHHRPNIQPVSSTSPSAPITAPSPQSTASTAPVGGGGVGGIRPNMAGHMDSSASDAKGYVSTAV